MTVFYELNGAISSALEGEPVPTYGGKPMNKISEEDYRAKLEEIEQDSLTYEKLAEAEDAKIKDAQYAALISDGTSHSLASIVVYGFIKKEKA